MMLWHSSGKVTKTRGLHGMFSMSRWVVTSETQKWGELKIKIWKSCKQMMVTKMKEVVNIIQMGCQSKQNREM